MENINNYSTNVDQKLLETEFLIVICRQLTIKNTVSSDFDPHLSIVKSIRLLHIRCVNGNVENRLYC